MEDERIETADCRVELIADERERDIELGIVRGEDRLHVAPRERLRGGVLRDEQRVIEFDERVVQRPSIEEHSKCKQDRRAHGLPAAQRPVFHYPRLHVAIVRRVECGGD